MSLAGLLGLIVLIIVGLVPILLPFLTFRSSLLSSHKRQLQLTRDELITSYERVLATMRDLEDDYKSQKISSSDYEREHVYWSQYGIRLLQVLEGQIQKSDVSLQNVDDEMLRIDQSVEEAIHNYRIALQSLQKS